MDAGNRARIASMLAHLARRGWAIDVVLRADDAVTDADVVAMRGSVDRLLLARPRAKLWPFGRREAAGGHDAEEIWCPAWLRRQVAAEVSRWDPDVVLVEYVFLSPVLCDLPPRRRGTRLALIDTHDVMSSRCAAYAQAGVPLQWYHASEREEARALARADYVLAISTADASALGRIVSPERIVVATHGRPPTPQPLAGAEPSRLVTVASRNDLNVAGLRWFFTHVWPGVRASTAQAELVVCGTVGEKLGDVPAGVVLRGFVDDLGHELERARVAVCPVVGGTGLKIKIVDALAHGRPVVTTSLGAAGFAVGPDSGVIAADEPCEFAQTITRLVHDDDHWRRTAAGARAQALEFAPEQAFRALDQVLAERLGSPPPC
jgi:glycosyltransferase involved in cell wall biosynthesis